MSVAFLVPTPSVCEPFHPLQPGGLGKEPYDHTLTCELKGKSFSLTPPHTHTTQHVLSDRQLLEVKVKLQQHGLSHLWRSEDPALHH